VAVKVPHAHLVASAQDADAYLAEARTAAGPRAKPTPFRPQQPQHP
jgi:hypothetical protein